MIIQKVDPDRVCFEDYSLEGKILMVAGIAIDLEAEQRDEERVLVFSRCNGEVHRGMMGDCCEYAAEVVIPQRRYEPVEVPNEDGDGEEPATHMEMAPVPLDVESVVVKLWPMEELQAEINQEEEEYVTE